MSVEIEHSLLRLTIESYQKDVDALLSSDPSASEWLIIQSYRAKIARLEDELKALDNG